MSTNHCCGLNYFCKNLLCRHSDSQGRGDVGGDGGDGGDRVCHHGC